MMVAAKKYVVVTALVIAKREDGSDVYLYQGAPVPDGLRDGEIKRLLDGEFLGEVPAPVETNPTPSKDALPDGDPTDKWTNDQLTAYAAGKSIDLGDATKKDDILAAIAAASK